jgi:HlyD family secretion protein
VAAAEQRVTAYSERLELQRGIVARGFGTRDSLQQLEERIAAARQSAAEARGRMASLRAEQLAAQSQDSHQEAERRQRALSANQSAAMLDSELRQASAVNSPADGQLIEWKAAFGTYILAGTPVASIASGARGLQFTMFLAAADGKRVTPGMAARIELSGLPREQWGTLTGRVVSVSRFPATREGMLAILRNDALVASLSAGGAPFIARIALDPQPDSPSGYRWAGGRGPGTPLTSGTTGNARVTILEQRPIGYVIGFLRRASGS